MYGYGYPVVSLGVAGTGLNPPVNTVAPAITGTATVGQTLTCSTGTWTGATPFTYTYQWKRNNVDILGATLSTYTLVIADDATSIKCTVTATNGSGSVSADSNTVTAALDTDAQAFITAATITNSTQKSAVNQLVVDMKNANIWSKMVAVYPFVGGTSTTHKWNLKDPRDLDAAFRLTFSGGWTHSSTGALPNGTNGYANTYIQSNVSFDNITWSAVGYYSRTNTASNSTEYDCGSSASGNPHLNLILRRSTNFRYFASDAPGATYRGAGDTTSTDGRGFFLGTQQGTNARLFVNGVNVASNNYATTGTSINSYYNYIGALSVTNSAQYYGNKECAFWFASKSLTNTEATLLSTAVANFQTTLGRNI